MPVGGPTSLMEFAQMIAGFIQCPSIQAIGEVVAKALRDKPEVKYNVMRQTANGPVPQQTSLAQIMAELTDQLSIANDLNRHLVYELQENRKIGKAIQKENRRLKRDRVERYDEDDDGD